MKPVNSDAILQQLEWRYAVQKFDTDRVVSAEDLKTLERAMTLAPSSYGLQPYKFIVIENPELRKAIRGVGFNQPKIEESSHLIVIAGLKKVTEAYVDRFIARVADVRGLPPEKLKGLRDVIVGDLVNGPRAQIATCWSQRQAYIALGFLLETAALLGIDAGPMEGFIPPKVDDLLGLTGGDYASAAMVALGYRSPDDRHAGFKKVRLPDLFERR